MKIEAMAQLQPGLLPLRSLRELGSVSGDFRRRADGQLALICVRCARRSLWYGKGRVVMQGRYCNSSVPTPIVSVGG